MKNNNLLSSRHLDEHRYLTKGHDIRPPRIWTPIGPETAPPNRDILWLMVNNITIVNFYRQNDEDNALDTLLQWPVPDRCLLARC
ncbi:hypothetical protein EDB80DRAFT_247717 [Ilyonectria destructans]|nr:hypothetical protein EDB80DRAFT_247717 [Ilyonectria destructans]